MVSDSLEKLSYHRLWALIVGHENDPCGFPPSPTRYPLARLHGRAILDSFCMASVVTFRHTVRLVASATSKSHRCGAVNYSRRHPIFFLAVMALLVSAVPWWPLFSGDL